MSKAKTSRRNPVAQQPSECCPKCGSHNISGLMAAFWVSLNRDGEMSGQWRDYEESTEIGPERLCKDCGHEFDN